MKIDVTIYQLADSNIIGSQTKRDLQDLMHHVKDVCGDCDPWEKIEDFVNDVYEDDGDAFLDGLYAAYSELEKEVDEYLGVKESRIRCRKYRREEGRRMLRR